MNKEFLLIYNSIEQYNTYVLREPNSMIFSETDQGSGALIFESCFRRDAKSSKSTLVGKVCFKDGKISISSKGRKSFLSYIPRKLEEAGFELDENSKLKLSPRR